MCRDAVLVGGGVVKWFGWDVDDERFLGSDTLESVIDAGWDLDEEAIVVPNEELGDFAARGRVGAVIVKGEFDGAADAGEVVGLVFVEVPSFDDAGVGGGHVYLAEASEEVVVAAQDFHQSAAFICVKV